jgi:thiamine-monophosphate kinase
MLVESTDVPSQMSLRQTARKSIIMTASDFACKGILPKYFLLSLGIPKSFSRNQIKSISRGISDASSELNVSLLGGDTNSSSELIINCLMIGFYTHKIPTRQKAKPGDLIYVTGPFGLTGAGLFLLLNKYKPKTTFDKFAIKSVLEPCVNLKQCSVLTKNNLIHSSIDSSDGLALSLYHLAEESNVSILLNKMPMAQGLNIFASKYNECINDLILYSGEEYETIFTCSKKKSYLVERILNKLNVDYTNIGIISSGKPKVYYKNKLIMKKGWKSFCNPQKSA